MAGLIGYLSSANPLNSIPTTIIALLLVYASVHIIYNISFHPLSQYPGPKLRAVSIAPFILALITGRGYIITKQLHDKKSSEPEMGKDPGWYVPDPNAQHLLWSNREKHSHYRRLFSSGFSDRSLREQEPLIRGYVDMLVDGLERYSNNGKTPLNIVEWFNWTTFDIIGDLTFGESFGCLENTDFHPWVRNMFATLRSITMIRTLRMITGLQQGIMSFLPRLVPGQNLQRMKEHLEYTKNKVTRRLNNTSPRPDFMDYVLRRPEGKGLTFPEMLSNSSILIIAGSETTATLLSGAIYLLLRNPDKMKKLVDEVRSSFTNDSMITIESASRLKYLPAVIEESLRMYSPVPEGLPRVVPKGGAFIDGKFVPEGTSVHVHQYSAYHCASNFEHPDEFIPERFLDSAKFNDQRDVLQPFMVGPRNCIGKNLAYAEIKLILSRMLYRFNFELKDESVGWMNQKAYVIWEKPPMYVYVTPRQVTE